MTSKPKNHYLLSLIFIMFGALFLLNNLGFASFDLTIETWWPLILVALGLHQLVASRFTNLFSLILLLVGGCLQLQATQYLVVPATSNKNDWEITLIM